MEANFTAGLRRIGGRTSFVRGAEAKARLESVTKIFLIRFCTTLFYPFVCRNEILRSTTLLNVEFVPKGFKRQTVKPVLNSHATPNDHSC